MTRTLARNSIYCHDAFVAHHGEFLSAGSDVCGDVERVWSYQIGGYTPLFLRRRRLAFLRPLAWRYEGCRQLWLYIGRSEHPV